MCFPHVWICTFSFQVQIELAQINLVAGVTDWWVNSGKSSGTAGNPAGVLWVLKPLLCFLSVPGSLWETMLNDLLEMMMTVTGWCHLWTWCYRCLSHRCLLPPTFASRYRHGSLTHIYSPVCVLTLQCSSTHINSSTKDELEGLKMFLLTEGLDTEGDLLSMKSYLSLVLLWSL